MVVGVCWIAAEEPQIFGGRAKSTVPYHLWSDSFNWIKYLVGPIDSKVRGQQLSWPDATLILTMALLVTMILILTVALRLMMMLI